MNTIFFCFSHNFIVRCVKEYMNASLWFDFEFMHIRR